MDWALAIERNRQPLLRIVAILCNMIGLVENTAVTRVSRPVYRAVLAVLLPAESAVRRLIVVVARGMVMTLQARRPVPAAPIVSSAKGEGRVSFRLFDPRRNPSSNHRGYGTGASGNPRISVIDVTFDPRIPLFRPIHQNSPEAADQEEDHTVNAGPLCRRLAAIRAALEDLPRQARRYARWRARPLETRRPRRWESLRTGPPPGLHRKPGREVDEILSECHGLARHAAASDTS
jgi:hypothetical protein